MLSDKDFLKMAAIYVEGGACPECPHEGEYEQRQCPFEQCAERLREIWETYN